MSWSSGLSVRPVKTPQDALSMLVCLRQLDSKLSISAGWALEIIKRRRRKGVHTFVACHDQDGVVGTASVVLEEKLIHNSMAGHIEDVCVHPQYQGRGVGQFLLRWCVDFCRQQDCYKVILDCSEDLVDFYQLCGFYRHEVAMRRDL